MAAPRLSIITAVHHRRDLLQAMLQSLEANTDLRHAEVILIDDASDPETAAFLDSLAGRHRVLRNRDNLGFAASNNLGIEAAQGETLAFLNSDLELAPGWLEPMLSLLDSQPNIGVVGNIQFNFRTGLIDHAGIFFDLEGMPTHARKNRGRLPSGPCRERSAATAACLVARRDLIRSVNGFDTAYRNGMEDVDLCLRLKQMGKRHFVSHLSRVRHHVSSSPGRHKHNDRNTEIYRQRWPSYAKTLGATEWPAGYLERYARHWWRMEPGKFLRAVCLLVRARLGGAQRAY